MRSINTPKGEISFPTYIPVTTFGSKYPLDALIQPYFPRIASAVMVSYHYARQMETPPRLPLMVDSGGFACLFDGSQVEADQGLGCLLIQQAEGFEQLTPWEVLDFQEKHADIAFTLDFPIPPKTEAQEGQKRHSLTIANALWALRNRRRKEMRLYAVIQGWDLESIAECATHYKDQGFDGVALGGMVPRVKNRKLVLKCIQTVREILPDLPLHVLGLGHPEFLKELFKAGVDSVDSSSYVKAAADGMHWARGEKIDCQLNTDRLFCAIENLAFVQSKTFPLMKMMNAFKPKLPNVNEEL